LEGSIAQRRERSSNAVDHVVGPKPRSPAFPRSLRD
jgi:hypothetical protein